MVVDLVTMGEILIDFFPIKKGLSLKNNEGFLRMPGGAPANVAVGAARLGLKTAFLGKVGRDPFGRFLIDTLLENGVEVKGVVQTAKAKTTLAFVILDENGERDFVFYRDPGADILYSWDEVNQELFCNTKVFHHGSISLISEPVRATTLKMARKSREKGILVSYDPNLRKPLWPDESEAERWLVEGLKTANIVKMSGEEAEFITGEMDIYLAAERVLNYGVDLLFITSGSEGSYYFTAKDSGKMPGFKVQVEDTTGAGDGFTAGILTEIIKRGLYKHIKEISKGELESIARYANGVGALTTTGKGAISSLPDKEEINKFLNK